MARTLSRPQRSKSKRHASCVPNDNAGKRFHKEKLRKGKLIVCKQSLEWRLKHDAAKQRYDRRGRERAFALMGWDTADDRLTR